MTRKQLGLWLLVAGLLTGCTFITQFFVTPKPRAIVDRYAGPPGTPGATTNPCTPSQPCTPKKAMQDMDCAAGDKTILLDGIYQGADYMLDLPAHVGLTKSGTSGARCVVQAQNELGVAGYNGPGVFIDGQDVRATLITGANSYWTFQGFDAGNSGGYVFWINCTPWCGGGNDVVTGVEFRRVVGFRATTKNNHVWSMGRCLNCVWEDIAGFGRGRNIWVEGDSRDGSVVRRAWFRAETQPGEGILTPMQPCYACYSQTSSTGTAGGMLYENTINVFYPLDPNENLTSCEGANYPGGHAGPAPNDCTFHPMMSRRDGHSHIDRYKGMIGYDYPHNVQTNCESHFQIFQVAPDNMTDIYLDGRANSGCKYGQVYGENNPIFLANNFMLGDGGGGTGDRFTSIRTSTALPSRNGWPATNFNECISTVGAIGPTLGGCPNFYTGLTGGGAPFGARNCFEYTNAVLGSTPATQGLWPWRMDRRIKAAITRAGARPLTGGAGSGYEAGTVTSEIAARYGPIPAGCSRTTTAFVPNFPVVTDFPSTTVVDDFNRGDGSIGANWTATIGSLWTIASQIAVAPASFSRNLYTGGAPMSAPHEVHAQFPTMPGLGGPSTVLVFAATDTSDANHYRLQMTRAGGGGNAFLRVLRVDGAGDATIPISDVDLGSDVSDGQSFGVRANATQTIAIYWKFTDGNWYRIATVIDTNLPIGAVRGGIGSAAPATVENYGQGTCCGGVAPSPGNIGRFGSRFPTQ